MKEIYAHYFGREIKLKEYWTDTILESSVPAGTDVARKSNPVRIYIADDADKEIMGAVEERATIMRALIVCIQEIEEEVKSLKIMNTLQRGGTKKDGETIARLRKELEFYADKQTYTGEINSVDEGIVIPIDIDKGERATEALNK